MLNFVNIGKAAVSLDTSHAIDRSDCAILTDSQLAAQELYQLSNVHITFFYQKIESHCAH